MAACDCAGCGGRARYLQEQREAQEKRNADFEAWYNAPEQAEVRRMARERADQIAVSNDKAYADVTRTKVRS